MNRYANWLESRAGAVIALWAALGLASALLAWLHLPIEPGFESLLPSGAPSVTAWRELESRLPWKDTLLVVVNAPDAASREAAAKQMLAGAQQLDPSLVARLESSDGEARAFIRERRWLYAPLETLREAEQRLRESLHRAKNPLLVSLDDDDSGTQAGAKEPLEIPALREAEARLDRSQFVSADGRAALLIVRTAFRATDVARDQALLAALRSIASEVKRDHPGVEVGFAGGPAASAAAHDALEKGMALSSLVCAALVLLAMLVHLRSPRALLHLAATVLAGTLASFGFAALAVGHLNPATAFLGAIIAGNGVNYGILLVSRFLEERTSGATRDSSALARAMSATLRPTLLASLCASAAYGALAASSFRGFRDFASIAAAGMALCWLASYSLLPALLARFPLPAGARVSPIYGALASRISRLRPAWLFGAAALLSLGAAAICARAARGDPFEYDLARLRPSSPEAQENGRWLKFADAQFTRGLAGAAGQSFLLLDDAKEAPEAAAALRALSSREPLVGRASSILDAIPEQQPEKLALLDSLRGEIDQSLHFVQSDDPRRAQLLALRPPETLREVRFEELPASLRAKLTEQDGSAGKLLAIAPGPGVDERDGRTLLRYAAALRGLELHTATRPRWAGTALLFADLLLAIQRDGAKVTLLAASILALLVLLLAGSRRRALAILLSSAAGALWMCAACVLCGLKIDFLDFIALPITLGIAIDYAANLAERFGEGDANPRALAATGGAVLLCSITTQIGYASLLLSDSLAIRGFGLAALLGELAAVGAALLLVPALLGESSACRTGGAGEEPRHGVPSGG